MSSFSSDKRATSSRRSVTGARASACVALFLGLVGVSACTATATISPPADSCSSDSSVSCVSGSQGYSCTGSAQPEDTNGDLVCSTDGVGDYCCSTSTCSYDSSVACVSGAIGYSCATGAEPPDQADPSLVCSVPTTSNNIDEYCCYTTTAPPSTSTCTQDQTVTCPQVSTGPSYGFSCTSTDTPSDDYSNLNCSAGVPASGSSATTYCCQYQ
jgi:hypothetical protein